MIKSKWIINIYTNEDKNFLLFSKEYNKVDDILIDFKGLTRNFLYDFPRWNRNNILTKNSRKKKSIEKYKNLEIIKTRILKDGTLKTQKFSL